MPITTKFSVGRDCDALCTKCKMLLAHTVVAMLEGIPVRVKCNTCHGEHRYRPPKGEKAAPKRRRASAAKKSASTKTSSPAATARTWSALLEQYAEKGERAYHVRETFHLNDVIKHPMFGRGVVIGLPSAKRVTVLFRNAERTLLCNHK